MEGVFAELRDAEGYEEIQEEVDKYVGETVINPDLLEPMMTLPILMSYYEGMDFDQGDFYYILITKNAQDLLMFARRLDLPIVATVHNPTAMKDKIVADILEKRKVPYLKSLFQDINYPTWELLELSSETQLPNKSPLQLRNDFDQYKQVATELFGKPITTMREMYEEREKYISRLMDLVPNATA